MKKDVSNDRPRADNEFTEVTGDIKVLEQVFWRETRSFCNYSNKYREDKSCQVNHNNLTYGRIALIKLVLYLLPGSHCCLVKRIAIIFIPILNKDKPKQCTPKMCKVCNTSLKTANACK